VAWSQLGTQAKHEEGASYGGAVVRFVVERGYGGRQLERAILWIVNMGVGSLSAIFSVSTADVVRFVVEREMGEGV